jgi:hypothetical protein
VAARTACRSCPSSTRGARYVVSAPGETDWRKNLRAAGGGQLGRRGRPRRIAADEISVDRRAPVIDACRATGGRLVAGYFVKLPTRPTTRSSWSTREG